MFRVAVKTQHNTANDEKFSMMDNGSVLERYKRFRAKGMALNVQLVRQIRSGVLKKYGKDLGIYKNGTLMFDSEDETSILMDYCIHSQRIGKKSFLDTFIEQSSYDPISDEAALLQALKDSHYTVLAVEGTQQDYLVEVTDILQQRTLTLVDTGLGQTAVPGLLIATRLIRVPASDFFMTTGAAMPVRSRAALDGLEQLVTRYASAIDGRGLSVTQEISFEKQLVRLLLRTPSQDKIQYTNPVSAASNH
jgi:hypothetical protein